MGSNPAVVPTTNDVDVLGAGERWYENLSPCFCIFSINMLRCCFMLLCWRNRCLSLPKSIPCDRLLHGKYSYAHLSCASSTDVSNVVYAYCSKSLSTCSLAKADSYIMLCVARYSANHKNPRPTLLYFFAVISASLIG